MVTPHMLMRNRSTLVDTFGDAGGEMSRFVQFIDSEIVQRWSSTIATVLFPLLVLPSAVDAAVEDASALNWAILLIFVSGSVALAATAFTKWRKHFARRTDT
ncbi:MULTISPECIES: hypothetical protein [Rhodococcus]|nr:MULTISPECIES: hypothetical protein [Rhodococcus]